VVLGLFVDLVVSRGQIPSFSSLGTSDQEHVFRFWASLEPQARKGRVQEMGLDTKTADKLATVENAAALPPRDQELLWRLYVYDLLDRRVRPEAAALVKGESRDQPLTDLGILSLVVRSSTR